MRDFNVHCVNGQTRENHSVSFYKTSSTFYLKWAKLTKDPAATALLASTGTPAPLSSGQNKEELPQITPWIQVSTYMPPLIQIRTVSNDCDTISHECVEPLGFVPDVA